MTEKFKEYQNIINESIVMINKENAYVPQNILATILADHAAEVKKLNKGETTNGIPANVIKSIFGEIDIILDGIDKDETEHKSGWWETSTGVEFGKKKLVEVKECIKNTFERWKYL